MGSLNITGARSGPNLSRFVVALAFFALLDFAARSFSLPVKPEYGEQGKARTWINWALSGFEKYRETAPEIVFLGSSLMLTPLNLSDARAFNQTIDGTQHHNSQFTETVLEKQTGKKLSTFNFAVPGEMPSDAFLIEKLILKGTQRPELIVYGVGPRDFMDNLLDSPTATDPYRWLSRLDETPDPLFASVQQTHVDQAISNFILPTTNRGALQERLQSVCAGSINGALASRNVPIMSNHIRHLLIPHYDSMSVEAGESLFMPVTLDPKERFVNNLDEYRRRYGSLNWQTFMTQLTFLGKLIEIAHARHTEVLLVVMPVTNVNRNLISSTTWRIYKNSLQALANRTGTELIDCQSHSYFSDEEDFGDTVHLNATGGLKMLGLTTSVILQNDHLRRVLGIAAHGQQKVAAGGAPI